MIENEEFIQNEAGVRLDAALFSRYPTSSRAFCREACAEGGLQFEKHLLPFDGEELDGHVAVEALAVRPRLHAVLVGQLSVEDKVVGYFIVFAASVLKGHGVDGALKMRQNVVPLALMLIQVDGVLLVQLGSEGRDRLPAVNPR